MKMINLLGETIVKNTGCATAAGMIIFILYMGAKLIGL